MALDELAIRFFLLMYLGTIFFGGILPASSTIRNASLVILVVIAFVRVWHRRSRIKLTSVGAVAFLFLFYVVMNRGTALVIGSEKSWLALFSLTMALSILLRVDSEDWLLFITQIIAVFGLVHAIATLLFLAVPNLYSDWFKPTFYADAATASNYKAGLTSHYSTNGMYLAWGLISAFFLGLSSDRGRQKTRWLIVTAAILLGILATTKRAHLVFGVACCFAVYVLLNHGKGLLGVLIKAFIIAVLAVVAVYLLSLFAPEIAGVVGRLENTELDDGRASYYAICLDMWKQNPVFGQGWNSFTETLYKSGIPDLARLYRNNNMSQNAHNVYLQLLGEEGALGLALFGALAISGVITSVKNAISKDDDSGSGSRRRSIAALSVGVQLFFLLYGITGNPLYAVEEYPVYLLLGLPLAFALVPLRVQEGHLSVSEDRQNG